MSTMFRIESGSARASRLLEQDALAWNRMGFSRRLLLGVVAPERAARMRAAHDEVRRAQAAYAVAHRLATPSYR